MPYAVLGCLSLNSQKIRLIVLSFLKIENASNPKTVQNITEKRIPQITKPAKNHGATNRAAIEKRPTISRIFIFRYTLFKIVLSLYSQE